MSVDVTDLRQRLVPQARMISKTVGPRSLQATPEGRNLRRTAPVSKPVPNPDIGVMRPAPDDFPQPEEAPKLKKVWSRRAEDWVAPDDNPDKLWVGDTDVKTADLDQPFQPGWKKQELIKKKQQALDKRIAQRDEMMRKGREAQDDEAWRKVLTQKLKKLHPRAGDFEIRLRVEDRLRDIRLQKAKKKVEPWTPDPNMDADLRGKVQEHLDKMKEGGGGDQSMFWRNYNRSFYSDKHGLRGKKTFVLPGYTGPPMPIGGNGAQEFFGSVMDRFGGWSEYQSALKKYVPGMLEFDPKQKMLDTYLNKDGPLQFSGGRVVPKEGADPMDIPITKRLVV